VEGLRADVARLALRVRRAPLDRLRDGLLGSFVGVMQLGAAALFDLLAELVMAARFPMLLLASWSTVARLTSAAFLSAGAKLGSADATLREDHVKPHGAVGRGSA